MEPPWKRTRLIDSKTKKIISSGNLTHGVDIKPVLADCYTEPIKLEKVFTAKIFDKKNTSNLIRDINKCLPLECLRHLKRVHDGRIILCRIQDLFQFITELKSNEIIKRQMLQGSKLYELYYKYTKDDNFNLKINLEVDISRKATVEMLTICLLASGLEYKQIQELCQNLKIECVATVTPKLRWQYEQVNNLWPCKFHPNKYAEDVFNAKNFTDMEKNFHIKMMSVVKFIADTEKSGTASLCVDPRNNSIIAIGLNRTQHNLLLHSPMVLIDKIACTQNGGVWEYNDETFPKDDNNLCFRGICIKYFHLLNGKFPDIKFGAERIDKSRNYSVPDSVKVDNLGKYGPYLATGYNVYLSHEPCLMCGMALLHSRVKTAFFSKTTSNGVFESKIKLHCVKNLNHHFEVFKISEI